jgi:hypothetical protein
MLVDVAGAVALKINKITFIFPPSIQSLDLEEVEKTFKLETFNFAPNLKSKYSFLTNNFFTSDYTRLIKTTTYSVVEHPHDCFEV